MILTFFGNTQIPLEFTMKTEHTETFSPDMNVEIDATFMERWLNGRKIESLSPKVLFDIKTVLRHYKDIIVPGEEVSISYPEKENGAYCSVDKKNVFISTGHLEKGYVDETIGLMVHELNHIKMSDSEQQIWFTCYKTVEKVLDSIFVPKEPENPNTEYVCLKDIVMCDPNISYKSLFQDKVDSIKYGDFLRTAVNDVAFLLNAVEDVRIDSLCAYNLKKYIKVGDDRCWKDFKEKLDEGEFEENNLMNVCFRLLFHHKGYFNDSYISKVFGDTDYIINSAPKKYTPKVLGIFKDVIKDHIESLWNSEGGQEGIHVFAISLGDMYLSGMVEDGTDSLMKDSAAGNDFTILDRAESDTSTVKFMESIIADKNKDSSTKCGGQQLKNEIERHFKPKIIGTSLTAAIHTFERVSVYQTKEKLFSYYDKTDEQVDYSVIIYDSLN